MNRIFIKTLILSLFLTSSLYSLDDDNNLNLQAPKKLNQIEGVPDILNAVKKDEIVDTISSSTDLLTKNMPDDGIDTSKFTRVKLIDSVLETLSHSDLLKSSREKVIQYEIKVKNAMADYYPTINFEYKYSRTRTTSADDGVRFKYYNDKTYKLKLFQNLYNGGGTGHNLESVIKRLEVAKNQYRITLDDEIKKAIKAYFDVVFTSRAVMVNERNMKKLNKILQIVTIKYDNGAASIGDLTSIKANVANSMTKLVKVQSKFIEALRYYEYIVGIDFENTLPFEKNFDVTIGEFEELYKRALERNRDLINYYKTIEVEKFNQKSAQSAFKPKLDFELSYEKTLDAEDLEEEETDIKGQVKLTYNLFNGGKDKNKVLEKSSAIRDLKYRLSEEKRKLKWNLSKIHTSITSVSKALTSTITEIKSSRKMVSAYWDAFKLGEQDLNTLLQGQRQLNTAESELVNYEKSHVNDFFNILELTGDLSSFFDVDPENPKFIDFSKSDYKKTVIAKDGEKISLDKKDKPKKDKKEDVLKEEVKDEPKEIPLPKPSIDENINKFLEEFKNFDDESYMIEISSFGNIYESFNFIKENNFDRNSFSFDVLNKLKIETRVAHNNFSTEDKAKEYLKALELKELGKNYKIKKVKDIKDLYEKYKNGLKLKPQKAKVKIKTKVKVIEKVRQAVLKEEFLPNEEFKNLFLSSNSNSFTINISTFANIDNLKDFIDKNDIYKDSFFFKYGNNGELIKLVNGVFDNYKSVQERLNLLTSENKDLFPVVEKIALVKKLYEENLELNTKVEEPITYEYINLSKEEQKKYPIKKDVKKEKKIESIEKASLDLQNEKEEKLKKIKEEIKKARELEEKRKKREAAEAKRLEKIKKEQLAKEETERKVEEKRLAERKAKEEAQRVEQNRKAAEAKRLEEIKREQLAEEKRLAEIKVKEEANRIEQERKVAEAKKLEEIKKIQLAKKEAERKAIEKRLAEEKKLAELKEKEVAEVKKIQLAKEEAQRIEQERKAAEAKKLEEIKKIQLAKKEAERKAIEKRLAEEKKLAELKEKEVAEVKKIQLAKEEAKRKAREIRLNEIKAKEEANRIEQERKAAEAKKLEEIKKIQLAKKEAEREAIEKRLAEERKATEAKRLEEIRKIQFAKEEATRKVKEKKLTEEKRLAEIKAKEEAKIVEQERKATEAKRLEEIKKIQLAKEETERKAKEKKLAEEKRLAEIKAKEEAKIVEQERKTIESKQEIKSQVNIFSSNKPIEEIDFAQGLETVKKRVEIPYSERLEIFKDKFYKAPKNKYTLKLTKIESNKVKWYAHRFGLDPNYVVVVKENKKSTIYYGIFNSIEEAKKKTETLHPLIYESKPPVKSIGSVR